MANDNCHAARINLVRNVFLVLGIALVLLSTFIPEVFFIAYVWASISILVAWLIARLKSNKEEGANHA